MSKKYAEDSLSIVIPSFNEAGNIERVVRESLGVLQGLTDTFDIVVIDDESEDESPQILKRLSEEISQLTVIRNEPRKGCHPSSLVGFKAAKGNYQYFIPGDGQIPADEITKFVDCAKEGNDVVYSWRVQRADPPHRRYVSSFYNWVLRTFLGIKIHDTDSSSLLTKRAVDELLPHVDSGGAFITVDILLRAERMGMNIGEVKIRHLPRTAGVATGLNFKDTLIAMGGFFKMGWWLLNQRDGGKKES
ncbi:MAG: glycosyltransferase family 2 protein [Vampirovibrio sp.]|nr:glycosyltransferase family 2 protein [Vampirovibrio sp.]